MQTNVIRDKVYITDTETTGGATTDQVIELAWLQPPSNMREWVTEFIASEFDILSLNSYNERFNPSVPINPHAQKVHGLGKLHLVKCRPSSEVSIPLDTKYLVGYNIAFDWRMLGKPEDIILIDLWTIVKILRKIGMLTNDEMDGRDKLDTLVSHYFPEHTRFIGKQYHNALDDCFKCVLLLSEILRLFPNVNTWDELHDLQTMGKKK